LAASGSNQVLAREDSALFWSISRDGQPAGFLLGTIHSEDPRVLDFSEALVEAMTTSDVFAMEMVPDLPTLQRLTDYMQYPDGTTLESQIGAERYARLLEALAPYRMPSDWVSRMKVWAVMMTLSIPPPETGFFMDFSLSLRAAGAGLKVVGLETLEQQLAFLEEMPMRQQLALLDLALQEYHHVAEVHRQMVDSYLGGDMNRLKAQAEEQMSQLTPETRRYFTHQGIDLRNQRMLQTLLSHLGVGRVFVAVGALHLPGELGLINLLRKQGYEMQPLPLPLNAAKQASIPARVQAQNR
jgi:hypothetical protein